MNICEIFFSIQGESTYAGLPCIFIRLAGCNLRCKYCDTTYSYETKSELSIEQILSEIKQYPCTLVEITGGEPLLQEETIVLCERLNAAGYKVLLETNGSQSIQKVPAFAHIIIDVKLPASGHPDSFCIDNMQWLKEGWDEFKFVISDYQDFLFAVDFIRKHKLTTHILLISPVLSLISLANTAKWIKDSGLPLRLQPQLHKIIWDTDTTGV